VLRTEKERSQEGGYVRRVKRQKLRGWEVEKLRMEVGLRQAQTRQMRNFGVELDRWNSVNFIIKDRAQRFHNFRHFRQFSSL
jgi:hypothetical protein